MKKNVNNLFPPHNINIVFFLWHSFWLFDFFCRCGKKLPLLEAMYLLSVPDTKRVNTEIENKIYLDPEIWRQ